jgi:hypothetical protein
VARVPPLSGTGAGTRVPADPSNPDASPAGLGLSRAWPASRPVFARKPADEVVNNSAVLQDDDHLKVSLDAGVYLVDATLIYDASTAADIKAKWSGGSSFDWSTLGLPVGATVAAGSVDTAARALADEVVLGGVGVGAKVVARVQGLLVVTAWTLFKLTWAQQAAGATDATMRAGSFLRAQKVG